MNINSYELLFFHFSGIIELTIYQAPIWPCSSVVERLHRNRKGHGFECCRGLGSNCNSFSCYITAISHVLI